MTLRLIREPTRQNATLGSLYVNGVWACWTLEDAIRDVKIQDQTCIPAGVYRVKMSFSNRFKTVLPEVLNVPNFTGIRIHAGNAITDTSGCILVGQTRQETPPRVLSSRMALQYLLSMWPDHEAVTLTIEAP